VEELSDLFLSKEGGGRDEVLCKWLFVSFVGSEECGLLNAYLDETAEIIAKANRWVRNACMRT
jgi:hypothetical protein